MNLCPHAIGGIEIWAHIVGFHVWDVNIGEWDLVMIGCLDRDWLHFLQVGTEALLHRVGHPILGWTRRQRAQ